MSDEYELIANAPNPFPLGYEPCMDVYPLLSPDEASYFQTVIRVMRWRVEMGRIDIDVEDQFEGTPDEIKEAHPPTSEASDNYVGSRI